MTSEADRQASRTRDALTGAAVADAATLGFHWLYDQERIRGIEPEAPEFHTHSAADYDGAMGYFAHAGKRTGDLSQYGEQMMCMLRSLRASGGRYDKATYEATFREYFGYGGAYVGYIDHPTRETLDNITRAENEAIERAEAIPFSGSDQMRHRLVTKILASAKQASGQQLLTRVEEAVRTTDDDDALVAHAFEMVAEFERASGFHGADDEQLPALSKLPPLIAAHLDDDKLASAVESAVRVTNDSDLAVEVAQAAAVMLQHACRHGDQAAAVAAGLEAAGPDVSRLMRSALERQDKTTPAVTRELGMACELVYGLPSIVHNLSTATSYRDAIRLNIYSGGDSCGRSILLGAIMGACRGVGGDTGIPESWIAKLNARQQLASLQESLAPER